MEWFGFFLSPWRSIPPLFLCIRFDFGLLSLAVATCVTVIRLCVMRDRSLDGLRSCQSTDHSYSSCVPMLPKKQRDRTFVDTTLPKEQRDRTFVDVWNLVSVDILDFLDVFETWRLRCFCSQFPEYVVNFLRHQQHCPTDIMFSKVLNGVATLTDLKDMFLCVMSESSLLEYRDSANRTLLMQTAHTGALRLTDALLAAKANPNSRGDNNWTPLHYAVVSDNVQICELLLRRKADVGALSKDGYSPLYYAYRAGENKSIMGLLHSYGARPDTKSRNASGTADAAYLRYSDDFLADGVKSRHRALRS